jgi:hypothetical protein
LRVLYIVVVDTPVPAGKRYITKTVPASSRTAGAAAGLALVISGEPGGRDRAAARITHIGVIRDAAGQKASTYDKRLKVNELFAVTPEPIEARLISGLDDKIGVRNADLLTVSSEEEASLLGQLAGQRPDTAAVIAWLSAFLESPELEFSERELQWREQRDAANVGLRIGGFPASPLRAWRRPAPDRPYLSGVVPYPRPGATSLSSGLPVPPLETAGEDSAAEDWEQILDEIAPVTEARLIDHDARVVPGWRRVDRPGVNSHLFVDGDRRMRIINIDNSGFETSRGADLIYYHANTESFVLVQYKRLCGNAYPVNDRLRSQLRRMEQLAVYGREPSEPHEWRIGPDFSFVKFADIEQRGTAPDSMVRGMYLSSSYMRILLDQEQTSMGYDTVGRYLTNKQFIDLVAHGLVGTVGVSAGRLKEIVRGLVEAGESVVLAEDLSSENVSERQRRLRSRSVARGTT